MDNWPLLIKSPDAGSKILPGLQITHWRPRPFSDIARSWMRRKAQAFIRHTTQMQHYLVTVYPPSFRSQTWFPLHYPDASHCSRPRSAHKPPSCNQARTGSLAKAPHIVSTRAASIFDTLAFAYIVSYTSKPLEKLTRPLRQCSSCGIALLFTSSASLRLPERKAQ